MLPWSDTAVRCADLDGTTHSEQMLDALKLTRQQDNAAIARFGRT